MRKPLVLVVMLLVAMAHFAGCEGNNGISPSPQSTSNIVDIAGVVTDTWGQPLEDVVVQVGQQTVRTNHLGAYLLENARITTNRVSLSLSKSGYHPTNESAPIVLGKLTEFRTTLVSFTPEDPRIRRDSRFDLIPDRFFVDVNLNSVVRSNGELFQDPISVAYALRDAAAPDFHDICPGDIASIRRDGSAAFLFPLAVVRVDLVSKSGELLGMRDNRGVYVDFDLSSNLRFFSERVLSMWIYDPFVGVWRESDKKAEGGWDINATIPTSTWVQFAVACEPAHVHGFALDCDGNALPNAVVRVAGQFARTDSAGQFQTLMPGLSRATFGVRFEGKENFGLSSPFTFVDNLTPHETRRLTLRSSDCATIIRGTLLNCDQRLQTSIISVRSIPSKQPSSPTMTFFTKTGSFGYFSPREAPSVLTTYLSNSTFAGSLGLDASESSRDLGRISLCPSSLYSSRQVPLRDSIKGVRAAAVSVEISPDGKKAAVLYSVFTGNFLGVIDLIDLESGTIAWSYEMLYIAYPSDTAFNVRPRPVKFSHDGRYILCIGQDFRVLDAVTGAELHRTPNYHSAIISTNSERILGFLGDELRTIDTRTWQASMDPMPGDWAWPNEDRFVEALGESPSTKDFHFIQHRYGHPDSSAIHAFSSVFVVRVLAKYAGIYRLQHYQHDGNAVLLRGRANSQSSSHLPEKYLVVDLQTGAAHSLWSVPSSSWFRGMALSLTNDSRTVLMTTQSGDLSLVDYRTGRVEAYLRIPSGNGVPLSVGTDASGQSIALLSWMSNGKSDLTVFKKR